eukprot:CAMPEP_0113312710 /NCGR_PEP_ID=MMETSP0010_2-20120614/9436_1 /TAXON_ID=216773 ORGANISM="Corethron hystrix, Strain 308" /NCGR_SAMPLE_ID=MMETSP0010_2 /ASSEMBLY_ACC=CAM_ASM_000155 /LENGTH=485 /DNA_ID=CAMNT_0000168599 /DNA_START=254 /DNA_END=1711 /DNA_ORIENTATION=+ /assembly_acc=CAM_ASM_000155
MTFFQSPVFFLIFLLLILLPTGSNAQIDGNNVYDVIIVGAGWAGLGAANELMSKGVNNFLILEADFRIGGRSKTIYESWEGESIPLDLGSSWIHGITQNPIFSIVTNNQIPYIKTSHRSNIYKAGGSGQLEKDIVDKLEKKTFSGKNGFFKYQESRQSEGKRDKSLRVVADNYEKEKEWIPKSLERNFFELMLQKKIEQDYAASIEKLSAWWWDSDSKVLGEEVILPNGYSDAIDAYSSSLGSRIHTGTMVIGINYKHKSTPVALRYADRKDSNKKKKLHAKKVIVTVPLGVLKSDIIHFSPSMPRWKKRAIAKVGVSFLNKIILFWSSNQIFWPKDVEWFNDLTGQSIFQFYNPYSKNNGKPYLVGFVVGDDASKMENKYGNNDLTYKQELTRRAMIALRNMFGQIPEPGKVVVTMWGNEPYIKGAYSYNKVGIKKWSRSDIALKLKKRVYFAGEATSSDKFGTTHGALISGKEAAKMALASLN